MKKLLAGILFFFGSIVCAQQPVKTISGSTTAVTQTTSPWIVAGGGTAGSPGTAALTIQGIGGGTAVPISGSVTAACSTACEVSPTTAANTLSNQFFTQLSNGTNGQTFMSTTTSSKFGADMNILSILGTAPTSAGFLDIKGADGNVFVRQTTAANLNATVVGTGTFATQSAITAASGSIASGAVASGAVASGAFASGSIASGACALGCIADGGLVTLGAKADAKSTATDTTAITAMQVLKEISFMAQTPAALPANQSVNVAQLNGHTTVECGVNGCLSVGGNIADGSALTSNNDPIVMAGKGSGNARVPVVCDNWAPFTLASTTALKIITLASSKNTYICSINIVSGAANNVALIDGTNSTTDCNGSTHGMAGGTTAATGWNFAANGGLTQGSGIGVIAATVTVSHDVCLLASGSGQISGVMSYTQF